MSQDEKDYLMEYNGQDVNRDDAPSADELFAYWF